MKYLFILNDAPYGSERTYNGLRLANSIAGTDGAEVSVFLMGDAVGAGVAGQTTPNGYYNLERMLKGLARKQAKVGLCGTCIDARGIKPEGLVEGAKRSSMEELTAWASTADHVLVF
jgi:uncharacterized protein involved in oxidation of intracellular sulfur